MLNKKHKLLELKTKALVDSLFVWNYKTKHKWRWIEFVDFKEYDFWDNIKDIDFVRSEKEWKILTKLHEEERELSIYFIVDLNDSYLEKYNKDYSKQDILLEILYLIWLSTLKDWNKLWALVNHKENKLFFAKKWKQNFINIIDEIENNLNKKLTPPPRASGTPLEKGRFKRFFCLFKKNHIYQTADSLKYFNRLKIKNSLVFYITDKLEFELKDLKILTTKNDLIFCNIFNSFENNLDWKWIIWVDDINLKIDLDDKKKISEYIKLRNKKITELKQIIQKYSWKYILFDETKNVYKEFYKLFNI